MRSANLIGQERSSDRIDLYFIFQWTRSVFMRGGAIHDRTTIVILILYNNNNNNASIKRNEPATILTLYLTLTPIFSGRKAKINLHTTPKLTAVMPISCLLPCADPGIFVGGGGGGGGGWVVEYIRTKKLWQRCLFVFCFFLSPQLILQDSNGKFQRKISFCKVPEGVQICPGGGVQLFPAGGGGWESNCLFHIETYITCDFPGGPDTLSPPLDPHLAAIYLASQSAKWCDHLLQLCLFSCNFVLCFRSSPAIKSCLELTAWLLPGLSNILHLCNSSLLSSITQ